MPSPMVMVRPGRVYDDLDPSRDSIRLLYLDYEGDDPASLRCKLQEAPFKDRPKYKAISYRWGESKPQNPWILVNGNPFQVYQNLWDCLQYLRRCGDQVKGPFWIDAICINQGDNEERNRQVRIMAHIYARASTVLVWLGKGNHPWPQLQSTAPDHGQHSITRLDHKTFGKRFGHQTSYLAQDLSQNPYWDRVWIIQEIGKAGVLEVLFADVIMDWKSFIQVVSTNKRWRDEEPGALRLARQVESKYRGAHTLKSLLYMHQEARSTEPRDKIYGFIGLANDADGFPVAYEKSIRGVWKDVMSFVWTKKLVQQAELLNFARHIANLLEATKTVDFSTAFREYQDEYTLDQPRRRTPENFRLKSYRVGVEVFTVTYQ